MQTNFVEMSGLNLRGIAVGVVITLGLVASIATSGYEFVTRETAPFQLAVADLDEQMTELVRFCPAKDRTDDISRFVYELNIEGAELRGASVPVVLSADGTSARTVRTLTSSGESHRLKLSVTIDQAARTGASACSPWARVTLGPLDGEVSDGLITWRLAISAEVSSGVIDEENHATLEIRDGDFERAE